MIWSYDRCKKEASKYKTKKSFYTFSSTCYDISRKKKWLNDFFN